MSKGLRRVAWSVGVVVLLALIAVVVMFGPPRVADRIARPSFCASCHEMDPWYEGFRAAEHSTLPSCNDCHLPNESATRYYAWEAVLGARDVTAHLIGRIPDRIEARSRSRSWIVVNCRRCHDDEIEADHGEEETYCWECHDDVYHDVRQGSSVPPSVPGAKRYIASVMPH